MRSFGRFFVLVLLVLSVSNDPATAVEIQNTGTVMVAASVPPIRYVYVDEAMKITKIVSNSDQNTPPRVFAAINPVVEVAMTPEIEAQYLKLKSSYNLSRVGEVYNSSWPKPVFSETPKVIKKPLGLSYFRISVIF